MDTVGGANLRLIPGGSVAAPSPEPEPQEQSLAAEVRRVIRRITAWLDRRDEEDRRERPTRQ